MRRKKFLVALNAVIKRRELAPSDPQVHRITVQFFSHVDPAIKPLVKQVIQDEQSGTLGGQTLHAFNEDYHKKFSKSLGCRHAYVDCAILLDPSKKQTLLQSLHDDISAEEFYPLQQCIDIHKALLKDAPTLAPSFVEKCRARFPLASYFAVVVEEEDEKENQ